MASETEAMRLPSGARVIALTETISTNGDAMSRLGGSAGRPFWIVAERQTGGRGRDGRGWVSAPGNLMASFGFEVRCGIAEATQLSLVAALAVRDTALEFLAPAEDWNDGRICLKWPNDVLVDGAKLAGILIETSRFSPNGPLCAVIGIGLNTAVAPGAAGQPTVCLAGVRGGGEPAPAPLDVLGVLDGALSKWLDQWDSARGWSEIRSAWLQRCRLSGRCVEVRDGKGGAQRGIFSGLSENGALLIDTGRGQVEIAFGDVGLVS